MLANGLAAIPEIYRDFVRFSCSGTFLQNGFGIAAIFLLGLCALGTLVVTAKTDKWFRNPWMYAGVLLAVILIPFSANVILFVTPGGTYHLMMRLQWALFPIFFIALSEKKLQTGIRNWNRLRGWTVAVSAVLLIFCYGLADNIGYTNLQRKYEKTYAYCVRLLDRIESIPGYYPGIPVAIVGVVGNHSYPPSSVTGDVTSGMIGLDGDYLLYRPENYRIFFQNYLGATVNFLPIEEANKIYYSDEYIAMESFPGETSVRLVDGVIYVKTENAERD